jgi:hypothetical protein
VKEIELGVGEIVRLEASLAESLWGKERGEQAREHPATPKASDP